MKEVGLSIMLFFNSLLGGVDPALSDERGAIANIKKEIKVLQREIEWESVTITDYATRWVKIKKINDKIDNLKNQIKTIEVRAKLKEKWAAEDSLEIIKQYPPLKLEESKFESI
jgi:vacuolar-type H+-ATPase subunit I/STV1